jgi:hypothetical protein
MQPLAWEKVARSPAGSFDVIDVRTVAEKLCIEPDYKLGPGHFLVNDLIGLPAEELLPIKPAAGSA